MIVGEEVTAQVTEYCVASTELRTRNATMVVCGFLTSRNGSVRIPSRELMGKFFDMVREEDSLITPIIWQGKNQGELRMLNIYFGDMPGAVFNTEILYELGAVFYGTVEAINQKYRNCLAK